jgi:hypothetical protein
VNRNSRKINIFLPHTNIMEITKPFCTHRDNISSKWDIRTHIRVRHDGELSGLKFYRTTITTISNIQHINKNLKFCDHGILIELLCFWTLSIFCFYLKQYNVSETAFCLRLQVEPTHLVPIDRASPYLLTGLRNVVFRCNRKQDDG